MNKNLANGTAFKFYFSSCNEQKKRPNIRPLIYGDMNHLQYLKNTTLFLISFN